MYDFGQGVPQDYAEAYVWYSLAVASGEAAIDFLRDKAAEQLEPAELDAAQKRAAKLFEEIQQRKRTGF
jgi:TPR repeat protein